MPTPPTVPTAIHPRAREERPIPTVSDLHGADTLIATLRAESRLLRHRAEDLRRTYRKARRGDPEAVAVLVGEGLLDARFLGAGEGAGEGGGKG